MPGCLLEPGHGTEVDEGWELIEGRTEEDTQEGGFKWDTFQRDWL